MLSFSRDRRLDGLTVDAIVLVNGDEVSAGCEVILHTIVFE